MVAPVLFKKELKQNAVIFIVPYLFLVLILILNRQNAAWSPSEWAELLTVSLPLAMAGAYGLQAFDLEENGRTKDFLLTKPLSLRQIVGTKYLSGLGVLLPLTILWIAALLPQSFIRPDLDNLNSFWLTLFLLSAVILYSACFLAGILIKGTVKLLAGIMIGIAALGWAGPVWCSGLTFLFYTNLDRFPKIALGLIYLFSVFLIGFFLKILISPSFQILSNTFSWKANRKAAGLTLAVLILLPLLLWLGNTLNHPAICAFDNLARSLATAEDWFFGLEGVRQPAGQLTALTDARGRLGLAGPGQKPEVIYVSTGITSQPLQNLAWSPDGRALTFIDHGQVKLYSLATKTTRDLGTATLALWTRNSRQLLVGNAIASPSVPNAPKTTPPVIPLRRLNLSLLDPKHPDQLRPVAELATNDLALGWDSSSNTLFTVNRAGVLTVLNLTTGQSQKVALLPQKRNGPVFFSKIVPPDSQSSTFALILCSFDSGPKKQKKAYTIAWYDLDPKTKKITLAGTLSNCPYKDFIVSARDHSLLTRSYDNGLYRHVKVIKKII
jgi:ABC-type transport system involved in multi-copper enzyme maturation permease subunit